MVYATSSQPGPVSFVVLNGSVYTVTVAVTVTGTERSRCAKPAAALQQR